MHRDGRAFLETAGEIVALHHARHGVARGQRDHAARPQRVAPLAVPAHLGPVHVDDQPDLVEVGLGVRLDLLARQRRARAVAPGRVADHGGEVADQRDHHMPQVLQLAHLVEHHRVAQVQVRRGGVHAELDAQRHTRGLGAGQLLHPVSLGQQLLAAPQAHGQGLPHLVIHGMGGILRRDHGGSRLRHGTADKGNWGPEAGSRLLYSAALEGSFMGARPTATRLHSRRRPLGVSLFSRPHFEPDIQGGGP